MENLLEYRHRKYLMFNNMYELEKILGSTVNCEYMHIYSHIYARLQEVYDRLLKHKDDVYIHTHKHLCLNII